jgi:hypothetical protein
LAERVLAVGLLKGKPQVFGERVSDGGDSLRVFGLGDDGIQGVKEEMRIDLSTKQSQLAFSRCDLELGQPEPLARGVDKLIDAHINADPEPIDPAPQASGRINVQSAGAIIELQWGNQVKCPQAAVRIGQPKQKHKAHQKKPSAAMSSSAIADGPIARPVAKQKRSAQTRKHSGTK